MARLQRFCPAGIAAHIIQRGNNRTVCFAAEEDFIAYAHYMKIYAEQFGVAVHAWVFMTNHVHLLVTPQNSEGVSLMMQSLGRRYVRYFNGRYRRTGTLWEGRFKSGLVDSETYVLRLYRYIELNPVRAGMVEDPGSYYWSSYGSNALGESSNIISAHSVYLGLGLEAEMRRAAYRALLNQSLREDTFSEIRGAVNRGLALGSEKFKTEIELLHGRRVTPRKAGRPKKKKG